MQNREASAKNAGHSHHACEKAGQGACMRAGADLEERCWDSNLFPRPWIRPKEPLSPPCWAASSLNCRGTKFPHPGGPGSSSSAASSAPASSSATSKVALKSRMEESRASRSPGQAGGTAEIHHGGKWIPRQPQKPSRLAKPTVTLAAHITYMKTRTVAKTGLHPQLHRDPSWRLTPEPGFADDTWPT